MGQEAGVTMSEATDKAKHELEQAQKMVKDAAESARLEAERTRNTVKETVKELKTAIDWVAGPPAGNANEAEGQIEELKARLERDVATLRTRIPQPSEIEPRTKRTAGAVVAGGAALQLGITSMKRRSARRDRQRQFREQATSIARELARLDLERITEDVTEELAEARRSSGGRGLLMLLGVVAGLAATWLARQR